MSYLTILVEEKSFEKVRATLANHLGALFGSETVAIPGGYLEITDNSNSLAQTLDFFEKNDHDAKKEFYITDGWSLRDFPVDIDIYDHVSGANSSVYLLELAQLIATVLSEKLETRGVIENSKTEEYLTFFEHGNCVEPDMNKMTRQ
ncbi:MAG: hypothetical protein AAF570_10165 [Bacteroidota bacterium]